MAKPEFQATPRTDWKIVAQEVNRRLGKSHPGQYVREVASGWRKNKSIEPILQELGLMERSTPEKLPRTKRSNTAALAA